MKSLQILPLVAILAAATPGLFHSTANASPEAAARQAASTTGGRVLSVTPSTDPNRPGYLVKVLFTDGRIKIMLINP